MGTKRYGKGSNLINVTRASSGYALTKAKRGPELVVSPDFSDAGQWSLDTGWSITGGVLVGSSPGSFKYANPTKSEATTTGDALQLTITIDSCDNFLEAGLLYGPSVKNFQSIGVTAPGTYTFKVIAENANTRLYVRSANITVSQFSVKRVLYNQPDGSLEYLAHPDDEPRIEYDTAGNAKGLLVEEARTNYATYSEDWDTGPYNVVRGAYIFNHAANPFSSDQTATFMYPTAAGTTVAIRSSIVTPSANSLWTASCYVKNVGRNGSVRIELGSGPHNAISNFSLSDGTLIATTYGNNVANGAGTIEEIGNGWYRCSVTAEHGPSWSGATNVAVYDNDSSEGSSSVGLLLWGLQVEEGESVSSYMPTTSASVTRAPDIAKIDTSSFGYNGEAGTWVAEFSYNDLLNKETNYVLASASNTTALIIYNNQGNNSFYSYDQALVLSHGSIDGDAAFNTVAYGESYKGGRSATNGSLNTFKADISALNNAGQFYFIGSNHGGTNHHLNGYIKSLTFYPRRLSDAQLQELSS